jgi:hypothetical protein
MVVFRLQGSGLPQIWIIVVADLPPPAFASAQQELDDAVTWYNQQADGQGKDFLDERAFCNQLN